MKFAFIPKGNYHLGQLIEVQGRQMQVESYSHTGKNVEVHSLLNTGKFERIVCITTDAEPIIEIPAMERRTGDDHLHPAVR